jgi:hypothetical protein
MVETEFRTLASTAGATLVPLLVTDGWAAVRSAMVGLWQQSEPGQADAVRADLIKARAELIAARRAGDSTVEETLIGEWQLRMSRLLTADPGVAAELRRLLLYVPGPSFIGTVTVQATPSPNGWVYQAASTATDLAAANRRVGAACARPDGRRP